jgi:molybdate transport system regulatory protein
MNILKGTIAIITTEGNLSVIKLYPENKPGDWVTAIEIDTASAANFLAAGTRVNILFKETEVIIAKNFSGQISVQNRFACTITSVEKGRLLGKIMLDYSGVEIASVITMNAVNMLELAAGDEVLALVKTTEISIAPDDRS